jgi:hypothetical protein
MTTFRQLTVVPALAVLALGVAACGSSSTTSSVSSAVSSAASSVAAKVSTGATGATGSAPVAVVGKDTSLVINPATAQTLKTAEITVTVVAPATTKSAVLIFPESGGSITVATLEGTIEHTGGLTFSHAGKSVKLTSLILDTTTKQLTALVSGQREPIFDLNLTSLARASGPNGTILASNIKMTVTSQAASTLNSGLGVSTFTTGMPFGVATLTVAVKT